MSSSINQSLESRVAKLEGQLSQLVSTVTDFITASDIWRREVSQGLSRITEKTTPNLYLLAAWSAIILTIVGAVGSLVEGANRRESERRDRDIEKCFNAIREMDTKLQREQQLVAEKITQSVDNINSRSVERHETAMKEVEKNWDWIKWSAQSDLEELRQRRLKDSEHERK